LSSVIGEGGAPVNFGRWRPAQTNRRRCGATWSAQFSKAAELFQKFFSKELML